ncbi:hypothetical protein [Sabulibacter ruber]|uniref:hypothetical protein n=1 Tax=Sabulibacter ruber TaxID=2811901 RepID=UPI001A96561A|nr:hypothetical protein [Sabulibacter ruber]
MAFFTTSDLKLKYSWNARQEGDNPNYIGTLDRIKVDRHEGYEVLHFINQVASDSKWTSADKAAGWKLEKMLRDAPSQMTMRKDLLDWIIANWKTYNK